VFGVGASGFLGEGGALEEHAVDLAAQGADAPAFEAAHLRVEVAGVGLVEREELDEVAPAQWSRQCRDNLIVREKRGELDHSKETRFGGRHRGACAASEQGAGRKRTCDRAARVPSPRSA